jgi:hypothetical protein
VNETSRKKLKTCHPDLQRLALAVDEVFPIQITCGARGKEAQNEAFKNGNSKLKYPKSKHNVGKEAGRDLSDALDAIPDPDRNPSTIDWKDLNQFQIMCLTFEQKADELGIKIRLGRDFKMKDWPHIERS